MTAELVIILSLISLGVYGVLILTNHALIPPGYMRYDSKQSVLLSLLLHVTPLAFIGVLIYEFAHYWESLPDTPSQTSPSLQQSYDASRYLPPIPPDEAHYSYYVISQNLDVVQYDHQSAVWYDMSYEEVKVTSWTYPEPVE